jgi:hypothetical protein
MPSSADTIEIETCPLCQCSHVYLVNIDRSTVAQYLPDDIKPTEKTFVRLFTCPTQRAHFQAEITLLQTPGERIKDVRVGGVLEPEP